MQSTQWLVNADALHNPQSSIPGSISHAIFMLLHTAATRDFCDWRIDSETVDTSVALLSQALSTQSCHTLLSNTRLMKRRDRALINRDASLRTCTAIRTTADDKKSNKNVRLGLNKLYLCKDPNHLLPLSRTTFSLVSLHISRSVAMSVDVWWRGSTRSIPSGCRWRHGLYEYSVRLHFPQ